MFADDVAACLLEAYDQLPKRGKPQGKEWTVLAGLVVAWSDDGNSSGAAAGVLKSYDPSYVRLEVVALATGNRCVGRSRMSATGSVVNDCHAEVLARRCLKRVLYSDLKRSLHHSPNSGSTSSASVKLRILEQPADVESADIECGSPRVPTRARLRLQKNASLHLCITETPCGDASIYETPGSESRYSKTWTGAKPANSSHDAAESNKGASSSSSSSPSSSAATTATATTTNEHTQHEGCLRTKSARSDTLAANRTLSMSCSDKIAMWGLVGLEGSLLSHFIEPIRLASVTLMLGHKSEHAAHAVAATTRAVQGRFVASIVSSDFPRGVHLGPPPIVLCSTSVAFQRSRSAVERRECERVKSDEDVSHIAGDAVVVAAAGQRPAKRRKAEAKKRIKLSTPCGFALCSTCTGDDAMANEVLISSRGVPQGTTLKLKPRHKTAAASATSSLSASLSALCKANLFASFLSIAAEWGGGFEMNGSVLKYTGHSGDEHDAGIADVVQYLDAKRLQSSYRVAKEYVLAQHFLEHWLRADADVFEAF
jgi:hypothetical protein